MSKQKIYHRYSVCQHGGCNKSPDYDVVGSEAAPFLRVVSVCKKHQEELDILQMAFEDGGEDELESMRSDLGFCWKESLIDAPLERY